MKSNTRALIFCVGAMNGGIAVASPADYIFTPTVEYGEREIDFKNGSARQKDGTLAQASSIGFGYGAKEYWFTEIYLKQERSGNQIVNIAEWENKFQLTETGKYPVDIGFITELESPLSNNAAWEFRTGPLLQTEFGKLQLNGNLLFTRAFGKANGGVPYTTDFNYQWQAKYRWKGVFEYGLQGLGEVGKWNAWNSSADQIHRAGPAVFGKLALGNRRAIRYNAAWLIGTSSAAPDNTLRMQVEYEF
jgi:hypothetical protein